MSSITKIEIMRAFSRSAASYDSHAEFQNEVAGRIAKKALEMSASGDILLDIGCGPGAMTRELASSGKFKRVVALDIAEGMAREAATRLAAFQGVSVVQADAEQAPVQDSSIDMVVSNMAMQWMSGPGRVAAETARILKPKGLFIGATLGAGTFYELEESLGAVLNGNGEMADALVVRRFVSLPMIEQSLTQCGFDVQASVERCVREYNSFTDFIRRLKNVGATAGPGLSARGQSTPGQSTLGLGRRGVMRRLASEYTRRFPLNGGVRATYNVITFEAKLR